MSCLIWFRVNSTRGQLDTYVKLDTCRLFLCRDDLCQVDFFVNESTRHMCRVDCNHGVGIILIIARQHTAADARY